jgi:hypothetical protein
MSTIRKLGALVAAGALVMALAGTSAAVTNWATPDDWYASEASDGSNDPGFWEEYGEFDEGACTKIEGGALDAVMNPDGSASLGVAYALVVVKQANPNVKDVTYDNTIFEDVAADETVFADTNGDGVYDEDDSGGISHIIVCDAVETTTTTTDVTTTTTTDVTTTTTTDVTTTTTTTFTQETSGETDVPTEPPTTTFGGGTSGPADGSWLLVLALGIFLASVVILTPAGAKSRS